LEDAAFSALHDDATVELGTTVRLGSFHNFDFMKLRCSPNNRQRLAKIHKDVQSAQTIGAGQRRFRLLSRLVSCAHDPQRGIYVPLSNTIFLTGKLPTPLIKPRVLTAPINEHFYTYFTNPLVIPHGHDLPGFDIEEAPDPIERLTNAGWLVVTAEYDWEALDEFDQNLDWFAGACGGFGSSPFAELDRVLARHHDYRGFSAVYSGRRSIHMHFVYDTSHLINAPHDADCQTRFDRRSEFSAVMRRAHEIAWRNVIQCMNSLLAPSREPDPQLASAVQWRRAPFGLNRLQKNCDFLGLRRGQLVPQLPIQESIRQRRPNGSVEWLLKPHLSTRVRIGARSKSKAKGKAAPAGIFDRALKHVRRVCEDEWGAPLPQAMRIDVEGGQPIIHFANHAQDQKPSSFVKGNFKKLIILGKNNFQREFYLPGDLTASELISWATESAVEHNSPTDGVETLSPQERAEIIAREREAVRRTSELYLTPQGRDRLFNSVEGTGKTLSLLISMGDEMLDRAMSAQRGGQHFMSYAARSKQQASKKRREYDACSKPFECNTVELVSFWNVYAEKCAEAGVKQILKISFDSRTTNEVMTTIRDRQPQVYRLIEDYRRDLWKDAKFDCGTTMIFTTKAAVRNWHTGHLTKTIFHPEFKLGISHSKESQLAKEFGLGVVAFDELEIDEFLHIWPEHHCPVRR
jgi:hypothetical protein